MALPFLCPELLISAETVEKGRANPSIKDQYSYLKSIDTTCRYASFTIQAGKHKIFFH